MAASLQALEPADYAVIGAAGLTAVLAVAACTYTVPWRCSSSTNSSSGSGGGASSPSKQGLPGAPTRNFNVLWHGRAALSLLSAAWALSLLLRVSSLWGANSFLLPAGMRAWTGAGWMCRIYLTASMGLLHPLCAFTTLLMLTSALSRRHRPESLRHPNARLLGQALLCTLPVAAAQAVIAWLGLVVQYQGHQVEAVPRSLLGYFFASYWHGSPQQCGNNSADVGGGEAAAGAAAAEGGCTACVFPAAAAITHAVFAAAFLVALCVTSSRLAAAVLNQRLRRRMRAFQAAYSLLQLLGAGAVGASVAWGPFSWANQACWLVFVATSLLTVLLVVWEVCVWPVRDLRDVDKRLVLWSDAFTAAAAEEAVGTRSSGGSSLASASSTGLIKAHGHSAEAEAYVQASATARTLSLNASQQQHKHQQPQQFQQQPQPQPQVPGLQPSPLQRGASRVLSVSRPTAGLPPLAPVAWSPRRATSVAGGSYAQQPQAAAAYTQAAYTLASPTMPSHARELLYP